MEHVNVVLVGAGISGLGMAHHLKAQCPEKTFLILEQKATHGGTWALHKYPGIRSDSDLYTFGYRFKPWTGAPIADGELILNYLKDVIDDDALDQNIRYNHKITAANWSSTDHRWTLNVARGEPGETVQISCDFFIWTGGYYDHETAYTPDWPGFSDFQGDVIHPQFWPEDVDLKDKRVIVIGSGATAATLIPNISDACEHVTMLQRSPTYFWTDANRNELADRLRLLELPEDWIHEIVRRDLLQTQKEIQQGAMQYPEYVKAELLNGVREHIGSELTEKHFTPSYRPWQQRLAFVPDADLFKAITDGKASVVTDHIDHFTPTGIKLTSGEMLTADTIITATGFNLLPLGGLPYTLDGAAFDPANAYTHRGIMVSDLPNFALMFGYLRTSWTMRVDLVADYICRLLNLMEAKGAKTVVPKLRPQDQDMPQNRWIDANEFDPGYMKRAAHLMPKSGDRDPWKFSPDYYQEKVQIPHFDLEDETLMYQ
ncbi:MAG: NAD(P)/FAD-dependent oxidoreductase [Pseudomonadota bacterium]